MSVLDMSNTPKIYDAIVVGAGLAGLVAALELGKHGYQILILESQNKIGGRIESYYTTNGYPVDGSIHFLNGCGDNRKPNPLLLAFPFKTKPIFLNESVVYDEKGIGTSLQDFGAKHHLNQYKAKLLQRVLDLRYRSKSLNLSLAEAFQFHINNIPAFGTDAFIARQFFTAMMTQNTGAELKDISFLELEQSNTYTGNLEWVIGGLVQNLIKPLERQIRAKTHIDIMLNSAVHTIHHEENLSKVRVITHQGKEFVAKTVLCTVPLGVLKEGNITFYPSLTSGKQQSIEHLKTGKHFSIILEFEKVFWPKDAPFLYTGSTQIDKWPSYFNLYALSDYQTPTLIAMLYNENMPRTKLMIDDLIEKVLSPLRNIFKEKMTPLKSVQITKDWSSDQNTLGALSFLGHHTRPYDRQALQTPDQALYFAGAHTEDDTLEGAYQSGMRSALQIMSRLMEEKRTKPRLIM